MKIDLHERSVLRLDRTGQMWYDIIWKQTNTVRARVHRRLSTSFRQILLHTALKILAIRKYACKFLPCLQKNLLENPHIFPMNTSSEIQQCAPPLRNAQVSRIRQVAQPRAPFFSGCADSPMRAVTDFLGMRMCSGVTVSPRCFCASSSWSI